MFVDLPALATVVRQLSSVSLLEKGYSCPFCSSDPFVEYCRFPNIDALVTRTR